jgi:hypothetical protein
MLSITDHVRNILVSQPLIEEMLGQNLLNTTQYAKQIQPQIEQKSYKKVEIGSIVTALSRLKNDIKNFTKINFKAEDISLKFPISEISYTLSTAHISKTSKIYEKFGGLENHFLNIVSGSSETTIFVNTKYKTEIIKAFGKKSKIVLDNLCLINLKFNPKYFYETGITYLVLKSLTWNNVNLVEIVSTYTEIGLIISMKDSQKAFDILSRDFL